MIKVKSHGGREHQKSAMSRTMVKDTLCLVGAWGIVLRGFQKSGGRIVTALVRGSEDVSSFGG